MRERGLKLAEKISKALEKNGKEELAIGMQNYMQQKFSFYGLPSPARRLVLKEVFENEDLKDINDEFVHSFADGCFANKYREVHYSFADFVDKHYVKKLNQENLKKLEEVNIIGQWWDITDSLATFFGKILLQDKELHMKKNEEYISHSNMWMRRIALIHQLRYKTQTDEQMLFDNILKTCHEKEFFITKAIGWALREYSKTNPKSVVEFIKTNKAKLSRLSKSEGLKYIKNHPQDFKNVQMI